MNEPEIVTNLHGDTVRWYREERFRLSQRQLADAIFVDRSERAGHVAIHRLESGSPVRMSRDEIDRLERIADQHGRHDDLYFPMDSVIVRDPAEGVRPFAGVMLNCSPESAAKFLQIAVGRSLPKTATVMQFPSSYLRNNLAWRMHAVYVSPQFTPTAQQLDLIDFDWLAQVEAYLRQDIPEYTEPEALLLPGTRSPYTNHGDLWPSKLLFNQLSRIESLTKQRELYRIDGAEPDPITDSDYRRLEMLVALRDAAARAQDDLVRSTIARR